MFRAFAPSREILFAFLQHPDCGLSSPMPVLSRVEGPVLSRAEGPVLSRAEGGGDYGDSALTVGRLLPVPIQSPETLSDAFALDAAPALTVYGDTSLIPGSVAPSRLRGAQKILSYSTPFMP
jgi:hypothetical protein